MWSDRNGTGATVEAMVTLLKTEEDFTAILQKIDSTGNTPSCAAAGEFGGATDAGRKEAEAKAVRIAAHPRRRNTLSGILNL